MPVMPLIYHQPGWELITNRGSARETDYLIWAPGEIHHDGIPSGKRREGWRANWQTSDTLNGDYVNGDSLEEVLKIFPPNVAAMFRTAILKEAKRELRPSPDGV